MEKCSPLILLRRQPPNCGDIRNDNFKQVMPTDSRGYRQHCVECQQFALRKYSAWRETMQKCIEGYQDGECEDRVEKEGHRRREPLIPT